MEQPSNGITLHGRAFLIGEIETVTGLHIGAQQGALEIGGVDNVVIRDAVTNRPYIPGSSLKGKMRSLTERANGSDQNRRIGQATIHECQNEASYRECAVCPVFGLPGNQNFSEPTRVIVRDALLSDRSAEELDRLRTDLPYSEIKSEVAIDRVTSAASPRQFERVPASAVFGPMELVFNIYRTGDFDHFRTLIQAMTLLEDDYLGGLGSRGSGKVRFRDMEVFTKARASYAATAAERESRTYADLEALLGDLEELLDWLRLNVPMNGTGNHA